LASGLQACNGALLKLLDSALASRTVISPPNWIVDPTVIAWQNIAAVGGKNIAGSLLVLQGVADTIVPEVVTTVAVNATKNAYPIASIEYLRFEGVNHNVCKPKIWLSWIKDRFRAKPAKSGYSEATYCSSNTPMPLNAFPRKLEPFP
jgi:hypothetical protein